MSENPSEFYANAVNIIANLYDVTLNFRAQSPVALEGGKPMVLQTTNECTVRMSPQHAKALAVLLVDHIKQYEKQFKIELPVEENLLPKWNEFIKKETKK